MPFSQNKITRFFDISAKLSFALMIIFIPFRWRLELWVRPIPPLYSDYTNFQLFLSDIALIYLLVFWGCSLLITPHKINLGNKIIFMCVIGLVIASWLSVLDSVDSIISRYHAFRLLLLLLLYLYIVNELQSPVWVIVPIALQIMIQAPLAIGQFLAQSSLGLSIFGEHTLDPHILGTSIIPVSGLRFLRAYGLSDHPNILGGSIAFALIVLFAVVLYGNKRQPIVASIIFLISFPALMLTFSRSAWLSFGLVTSLLVIGEALAKRWDSVKRVFLLGILSLLILSPIIFANKSVFEKRITSVNVTDDGPMQEREYLLEAGNTLFVEHPAFGIGLNATPLAMKERYTEFRLNFQPPHYLPLTVPLETGVLGGISYLLLFLVPIILLITKWRIYLQNPFMMSTLALIFAISIISLFDYYTWYVTGRAWQWLAWGLFSLALQKANT